MSGLLEQTPRSLLVWEQSSFKDPRRRVEEQVEQHNFNYQVSVLLPECSSAPSHLTTALNSFSSFYLVRNLPVYELLNQDFLHSAVYQGSIYALSYGTRIDEDNCVALTPQGHLSLSLDKESFQVLGVEGKPSQFNHRSNSRFVVRVNLTDSNMAPGGRGYNRLLTGLKSRLPLHCDFLLSHHPGGGASLKALLSRYSWSEQRPDIHSQVLRDLQDPDPLTSDPHSFLEWLGAVNGNINCQNSSSCFLSSLAFPGATAAMSGALSVSVSGLLLPQDILHLLQQLRTYLAQRPRGSDWSALTVHGFADSPVSWRGNEHGFLRGGENFYSLVMFQDDTYHLHLATGAHDTCPP